MGFPVGFGLLFWLVALCWNPGWLVPPFTTLCWVFLVLGGICSFLALHRGIRMLHHGVNDRWVMLFYMLPAIVLMLEATFTAEYLRQATGRLTALPIPANALRQPQSRFYTVRQAYAFKNGAGVFTTTTSLRKDKSTRINLYIVCPLLASAADTARLQPWVWVYWHNTVAMPDANYLQGYQGFVDSSLALYRAEDLTSFTYLEQIHDAETEEAVQEAVKRSRFYQGAYRPVCLELQTGAFANRTAAALRRLGWTIPLGLVFYLLILIFPSFSRE